jgi:hydrogenase 3 maturation protease
MCGLPTAEPSPGPVSKESAYSIFRQLEYGSTLIITVGHPLRGDDGVGPYIAQNIFSPKEHIFLLNAGERPENIVDRAAGVMPARTIIIDAADFGGDPGEARLLSEEEIPGDTLSTHAFPLGVIARILARDTGSEIFFLGIQPGNMEWNTGLSSPVKETAQEIIRLMSS